MSLVSQSAIVAIAGLALSTVLGLARVLPNPEPPTEDVMCATGAAIDVQSPTRIGQKDAKDLFVQQGVAFVDARSLSEFEVGHVAGAIHVPMNTATIEPDIIGELAAFSTIVVYCSAVDQCSASTALASALLGAGLADVRVLDGGFPRWFDNGYPAQAGDCARCN